MAKSRAKCGTTAGYRAHKRHNEPSCDSCKSAMRDYWRKQKNGELVCLYAVSCLVCSGVFVARRSDAKACSRCNNGSVTIKLRSKQILAAQLAGCIDCGMPHRRHRSSHNRCVSCSEARNQKRRLARMSKTIATQAAGCDDCGKPHRRHRSRYNRCVSCSEARNQKRRLARMSKTIATQAAGCIDCGKPYRRHRSRHNRCVSCSKVYNAERARQKTRKRRLTLVGDYTLQQIGDRDGWRCHLCSNRVRADLSGMHPQGPTIDHLIPVSCGGSDDPVNVALAHRECNVKRSNRGPAQLRLIG